jgi:hypothetical protein
MWRYQCENGVVANEENGYQYQWRKRNGSRNGVSIMANNIS